MKPIATALAIATASFAVACTLTTTFSEKLDPGRDARLSRDLSARGVQVYECRAAKDAATYAWTFVEPDAELFDARGHRVGRHGAGPFWEALDGSRVEGRVRVSEPAPYANAIPWLLLDATDTGRTGILSGVTQVQRINTFGGTAPTEACGAQNAGRRARVEYVADYRFFTMQRHAIQ